MPKIRLPLTSIHHYYHCSIIRYKQKHSHIDTNWEEPSRTCEVIQMMLRYMEPEIVATGPEDIALEAIREVGSDGHYFGIQHTQDRYEKAFYQPFVSDWRNFEAFLADGEVWTAERAHNMYKRIIEAFEAPPMADDHREALADFVARRKAEGGAPTDF